MKERDFKVFVDRLTNRLGQPLPGRKAHELMVPRPINERRFREDPQNPARPGGVLLLLYPHEGDIYIPLMKRPEYNGAHSGQVSLPGGKQEKEDSNLVETALRETHEEIGIPGSEIEVLGQLSEMFIIASNFKVFPTIGVTYEKPLLIPDQREVVKVLTPSLSELSDVSKRKVKTMHFPPYTIQSPYYDIEGEIVWGATAMILSELLCLVEDFR